MGASVGSGAHLGLVISYKCSLWVVTWQLLPVVVVGVEPSLVWFEVSICKRRGWERGVVTHLGCCDVVVMLAVVAGPKRQQDKTRTRQGGGGKKEPTWGIRNFEPKHHVGNSTQSRGVGVLTNLAQIL